MKRLHLTALVLFLVCAGVAEAADPPKIAYTGDGSDLQAVIDAAPVGATVTCDAKRSLDISKSITIRRALTLSGLHARLPKKLGRTPNTPSRCMTTGRKCRTRTSCSKT